MIRVNDLKSATFLTPVVSCKVNFVLSSRYSTDDEGRLLIEEQRSPVDYNFITSTVQCKDFHINKLN